MRLFTVLALTAMMGIFQGCGTDTHHTKEIVPGPEVIVPGPDVIVEVAQKFEGAYFFEEVASGAQSGPLEIIVRYDGEIEVEQISNNDKLVSQNFNGSFGTHPLIRFTGAFPSSDNKCFQKSLDVTYSGNDDLEEDGSSTDLGSGKHFTSYKFCVESDGSLKLDINIYDGSLSSGGGINGIVIQRSFTSI